MRKSSFKLAILYLLIWLVVSALVQIVYFDEAAPIVPQLITTLLGVGMVSFPLYITVTKFIPQFLYQKKIKQFLGYILLLCMANTILSYLVGTALYGWITNINAFEFDNIFYLIYLFTVIFSVNSGILILGSGIKILVDRYKIKDELENMETERMKAEVSLLRAQLNPHFFFNVLNTVYFQIENENIAARSSIEMLSDMLRYQLYESAESSVQIEQEIKYLSSYINLQRLRLEKDIVFSSTIDENISGFSCAPLLLLPLVENAFKHLSKNSHSEKIELFINVEYCDKKELMLSIQNTYSHSSGNNQKEKKRVGGIGLVNLRRRLELLYPDAHELTLDKNKLYFTTTLKLNVHDKVSNC